MTKKLTTHWWAMGILLLVSFRTQADEQLRVYFYDESTKSAVSGLAELTSGAQIQMDSIQGVPLNLLIVPNVPGVASMSFSFNGGKFRTENEAPFTVLKETGRGNNDVLIPGSHSFVARAYSKTGGKGQLLRELTLSFALLSGPVSEEPGPPAPTPAPAKDYTALIAEQFVKGDRFAKKNAAHLAKNKKMYQWPPGRSKSNPHDCYIVSRAYHDHMKFYEKGYAPIRSLYMCP